MNLDFGILWIEDAPDEQEKIQLEERVLDAGFIARIVNIPNGDKLEDLARDNDRYHLYDLVLLDYRLGNKMGDTLAIKVRDLFPATTILFYSGDADEVELRNLIAQKKVEGVFCSHRNRFIERTGTLIDQLSQSLNRLSGMRGLAMRVVAECDEILEQAIQFMTSRSEQYKATMGDLDKDVCSSIRERKKQYRDAMQGNLDDRLGTHAIDSSKLHNHFRRQSRIVTGNSVDFGLSEAQAERLRELRASTAQYEQDVLTIRNVLAHAMEKKTTNGWILKGHKEEDKGIKVEDFPSIRRTFASHVKDFAEMKNLICPPDQQAGQ